MLRPAKNFRNFCLIKKKKNLKMLESFINEGKEEAKRSRPATLYLFLLFLFLYLWFFSNNKLVLLTPS